MLPEHKSCAKVDNNISKTGYRALFLLLSLIKSPKTRDELIELFSKDSILGSDVSKDTLTITINTLKKADCIISRPNRKTNNKYVLKSHPFHIHLTKENVYALHSLREDIITLNDFELLIYLNNLYFKIAHLAPTIELQNLLLYKHPLNGIDYEILNELVIYTNINKHTNISYNSPQNGKENLDFIPKYFSFENGKLYVWGFCEKHNDISFLRVDRIKKVNLVTFAGKERIGENIQPETEIIKYSLKGYSAKLYVENENEKIIYSDTTKEPIIVVESCINNKFNFFQRILSYGQDCKIIYPESVKLEFLEILQSIKRGYLDEN